VAERPEAVLAWDGPGAPPRRNCELAFDALWESRVFGMTMTLYERGAFRWEEFRDRLIEAIAAWEHAPHPATEAYPYWRCWLTAFERVLADKDLCGPELLEARIAELAARPPGHDHGPA